MKRLLAAATIAAGLAAGGVGLLITSDLEHQVNGTPVANTAETSIYADEMEAKAILDRKTMDEVTLRNLERFARDDMQAFLSDPVNGLPAYIPITVIEVSLIKAGDNRYEGMANMQAGDGIPKWIKVHVVADGTNAMWSLDEGALLPLFEGF